MTTLPRLSELGLLSLERPTHSSKPTIEHSPLFSTYRDDLFCAHERNTTYLHGETAVRSHTGQIHRLPGIQQLPTPREEQYGFYHGYFGPSLASTRRSSVASNCSTPSLAGSFASTYASSDGWRTPTYASTPYRKFQDLAVKETANNDRLWSHLQPNDLTQISLALRPAAPKAKKSAATRRKSPTQPKAAGVQKTARRKFQKQDGDGHCNIKYTDEQHHFLIYLHVDLSMSWAQIAEAYNKQWPQGPHRSPEGLHSISYRQNEICPVRTEDGLLIFGAEEKDEAGNVAGHTYNKWDNRVERTKIRDNGKVSLIDRYAEQIAEANYSWIRLQDMERARELAAKRRPYRLAWEARFSADTSDLKAKL